MDIVGKDLLRAFCKLFYLRFVFQVNSEKTLCSKDFTRNLRDFYAKIIAAIIPANVVTSFLSSLFFQRNQKQEWNFQQVGGLLRRNSFAFCLWQVILYLKGVLNSMNFYKRIFLHVIPVRIIVPWLNLKTRFVWEKEKHTIVSEMYWCSLDTYVDPCL